MDEELTIFDEPLGDLWREFLREDIAGNNYYRFSCLEGLDEDFPTLHCEKTYAWIDDAGNRNTDTTSWCILIKDAAWCNFVPHECMHVDFTERDDTLLARQCADNPFEYTIYVTAPAQDPPATALKLMDVALEQASWWTSRNPHLPAIYTPHPLRSRSSLVLDLGGNGSPIVTAPKSYIAAYIQVLNLAGCEFKVRDQNMREVPLSVFKDAPYGSTVALHYLSTERCAIVARRIEIQRA